tara:strand:+ start:671 stop:985 length:315 start_codon:yes stop_codon:yes gene_type:complete
MTEQEYLTCLQGLSPEALFRKADRAAAHETFLVKRKWLCEQRLSALLKHPGKTTRKLLSIGYWDWLSFDEESRSKLIADVTQDAEWWMQYAASKMPRSTGVVPG